MKDDLLSYAKATGRRLVERFRALADSWLGRRSTDTAKEETIPACPHPDKLSGPGLKGDDAILTMCHCGALLIRHPDGRIEWHL